MTDDVDAALLERSIPLSTADFDAGNRSPSTDRSGGDGLADRSGDDPADRFGDADVVGLGEATHGTREFVAVRTRLARFLVAECGFRTVALEAGVGEALAAHDYVRYGDGDPRDVLGDLDWFWRTEGTLAFLRWLRSFNEGRPVDDRVRLRGIDVEDLSVPFAEIRAFLRAVDPDGYRSMRDELDPLADDGLGSGDADPDGGGPAHAGDGAASGAASGGPGDDPADPRRLVDVAEDLAARIRDRIDRRRSEYAHADARDPAVVADLCAAVEGTCEWLRAGGIEPGFGAAAFERRDRTMAGNVARRAEGRGVVVLAHQSHVKRGRFDDGRLWSDRTTMGEALDREFGDGYRPVGCDFARGRFRAIHPSAGDGEPRPFAVGEPLADSATARLDGLPRDALLLDLSGADGDARTGEWFARPRRIRNVGAVFDPAADPEAGYLETDLPGSFEDLLFVRETAPSRLLAGDR